MNEVDIRIYSETLELVADAAGSAIRPYFRAITNIDIKNDKTPVTAADKAAELAIREILADRHPDHGQIGEEFGTDRDSSEYVWVIDPIDGTSAFISGQPTFCTLIGLTWRGKPILGLIDQPIIGERWVGVTSKGLVSADPGEEAYVSSMFNGKPIHTRSVTALAKATLYATSPDMFVGIDQEVFGRLSRDVSLCRYGLDGYAYGLLALGCIDLVAEASLEIHDYCALVPIIEGAGGVATDWRGEPLSLQSDGHVLASGSQDLHRLALKTLGA